MPISPSPIRGWKEILNATKRKKLRPKLLVLVWLAPSLNLQDEKERKKGKKEEADKKSARSETQWGKGSELGLPTSGGQRKK